MRPVPCGSGSKHGLPRGPIIPQEDDPRGARNAGIGGAGTPYLIPYRVRDNRLEILRIYHGARRWPKQFE